MSDFIDDAMVEAAGAVLLHCPLSDAAFRQILEAALPMIGEKLAKELDELARPEGDDYTFDGIKRCAARIRELTREP